MPARRTGGTSPPVGTHAAPASATGGAVKGGRTGKGELDESGLSEYEAARLRNIARNAEMLANIGIDAAVSSVRATQTQTKAFAKPVKRAREPREPVRRSTRGKDSDGNPIAPMPVVEEVVEEHVAPSGPVDMREEGAQFADSLKGLAVEKKAAAQKAKAVDYSSLTLGEDSQCSFARLAPRVKVVKERIFSMAFHPSPQVPLVVAGDKWGQIGFLDLRPGKDDDRVFALLPHGRPVSALAHTGDGSKLFSSSYDGTVRCFDYEKGVFELLLQNEDEMYCHLALSCDVNKLYVAGNRGDLYVVDPRSNSLRRPPQELDLHDRKIATVDGHPSDPNVFVTASNDQTVKVWDVRKTVKSKPLHMLEHTLAVTGAYYAPAAPHLLVTTCNDNLVRFWTPAGQGKEGQVIKIKHNNNTGRYITNFRAVWDPKSNTALIGNMNKKVDFLAADGKAVASISHDLCSAIPAVNVAHPHFALVASGNGSGYINVWAPPMA